MASSKTDLWELLSAGVILGDGGMGTQLFKAGCSTDQFCELWNIAKPTVVSSIHTAYVDAGAQVE